MGQTVSVDDMAKAIMDGLEEYADLTTDNLKKCVKEASASVRKDIQENAPKRTGNYKKSWATKTVYENSNSLDMIVYSKNRYQLAHLLEHGHALKAGGRTQAYPHILPAEQRGIKEFEDKVKKSLGG